MSCISPSTLRSITISSTHPVLQLPSSLREIQTSCSQSTYSLTHLKPWQQLITFKKEMPLFLNELHVWHILCTRFLMNGICTFSHLKKIHRTQGIWCSWEYFRRCWVALCHRMQVRRWRAKDSGYCLLVDGIDRNFFRTIYPEYVPCWSILVIFLKQFSILISGIFATSLQVKTNYYYHHYYSVSEEIKTQRAKTFRKATQIVNSKLGP